MNFSILKSHHKKWRDILVIGKTIERDNRKYHIVGMTLSEEAKLYIIEPCTETETGHKPRESETSEGCKRKITKTTVAI